MKFVNKICKAPLITALLVVLVGLVALPGFHNDSTGRVVLTIGPKTVDASSIVNFTASGVADQSVFTTAYAALPAAGGEIDVLAGTYNFTATSTVPANVIIKGMGIGTVFNNNGVAKLFTAGANTGVVFKDFKTDAGGITQGATTTVENVMVGASYLANTYPTGITSSGLITGTQLVSTIGIGTSPLSVTSTTKVTNLNADLLDGYNSADFAFSNGVPTMTALGSAADAVMDGPQCVLASGRLAYVASWSATDPADHDKAGVISVWDISGSTPVILGSVSSYFLRASPHKMALYGGRYLVTIGSNDTQPGWNDSGLAIVDVSNPSLPVLTGHIYDATNLLDAHAVTVDSRGYAWVADSDGNGITAVNITDPANPFVYPIFTDATLGSAIGLDILGNLMYVTCNGGGIDRLTIVDITNPGLPVVLGSVQDHTLLGDAHDVKVRGKYAYVVSRTGNALVVVDVGDTATPTIVGSVVDATYLSGAHSLALLDKYAVVAAFGNDYLTMVDISNPAAPVVSSSLTTANFDYPGHVDVVGNIAVVTAQLNDRLHLINLGGPSIPSAKIGSLEVDNLMVNNNAAFVQAIQTATGSLQGKTRLVMLRVPPVVLNLSNSSDVAATNLDLSSYVSENAIAVQLRLEFKDTGSAASPTVFVVRYSDTYDTHNLAIFGWHIADWSHISGLLALPPTKTLRYILDASGAGTASVKVYVMGYFE